MKIISLTILSIALSISLSARENPFEPTDHFLEQKKIIIQANELEKVKKEQEIENKIAQEIEAKKLLSENEAIKIIEMKKASEAQKMMKIKEQEEILSQKSKKDKAMEIAKLIKDSNSTETVMKKPYIPEIKENFKVLPFVKMYVVNDVLTIEVDKKYTLLNQDILKPVKKLLFDFKGKVSFYTVRKDIISESFKSLTVGTHMEDNFFRVVIDLPYDIINYTEKIDSKNGIITITKKK